MPIQDEAPDCPFEPDIQHAICNEGTSGSTIPSSLDAEALLTFWYDLLSTLRIPDSWPEGCELFYISDTKTLVVDYEVPSIDLFPKSKDVVFKATSGTVVESRISGTELRSTYDSAICQIALANLYKLFVTDQVNALVAVVFNGWVRQIDRATGTEIHPCILSMHVDKVKFLLLNLLHVEPRACVRSLKGLSGSSLADANPIQPLLVISREDSRFVPAYGVADSIDRDTNLAAMDWQDFENLIREIFEKEFSQTGGEVKITRASRDGGVDAIAFDPDPIRGGKIVIQAKRYTNVVELSAVRDLYGTVHNEGAMKGILVTTSNFGPDAYQFANGKPLTLISGGQLLELLGRHGHNARIDLAEARAKAKS